MKHAVALLALLAALPAGAQPLPLQAHLLIVTHPAEVQQWAQRAPEDRGGDAARLREVPANRKVFFPIIASGLTPPADGEITVVADLEFLAPGGKSVWAVKACCKAVITNRPDVRTIALGPVADVEMEAKDATGEYTVRVTLTDGTRSTTATEKFHFAGVPKAPRAAPARAPAAAPRAAPKLESSPSPARDSDKRDCLALETPAEVIRCTERR